MGINKSRAGLDDKKKQNLISIKESIPLYEITTNKLN